MESMTPNSGWERLDVSGEDVTEELCVSSSKKKKKSLLQQQPVLHAWTPAINCTSYSTHVYIVYCAPCCHDKTATPAGTRVRSEQRPCVSASVFM